MKMTTLLFLTLVAFTSFGLLPTAQAVSPPPDGCYAAYTTGEGCNALQSLTTGLGNTGLGWYSLFGNSIGSYNTAIGAGALISNNADNNTATGAAALLLNTTGNNNTAAGADALALNNTGTQNTADGAFALYSNTAGSGNIAIGYQAGSALTNGNNNIAIGNIGIAAESNTIRVGDPAIHAGVFLAGITAMSPAAPNQAVLVNPATAQLGSADISSFGVVSTDPGNTAVGDQVLVSNTGDSNTGTGFRALFGNTTGVGNTAAGAEALENNGTGGYNDAVGAFALSSNIDGSFNNAFGNTALSLNIHASENTAIGDLALANNDSTGNGKAQFNTAVGAQALLTNTDGDSNNAVGWYALGFNTTGASNQAIGVSALLNNDTGSNNIAIGDTALSENLTGSFNTVIGYFAGASVEGNDNIYIGATSADGVTGESSTIRIGDPAFVTACYVAGISGQITSGGVQVFITGEGKLGTLTSSARFKDDIKPMANASESILGLNPVTFRYKKEIDSGGAAQFGLVAEDVEKVNPDLVVRDKEGKPYSVRYDQVNAMLLNEFLKAHRQMEQQEAMIARQQKQIEALTVGLQKVSTQLEVSRSTEWSVLNDR
jgi:trimeric autotransporter adhesin